MAKLSVIASRDIEPVDDYPAPAPRSAAGGLTARLVSPPGYPLWAVDATLADGAAITWSGVHGEDAVYVLNGELEIDGRRCPADGAVIVESDVAATARAIGTTRIVHFGSADETSPADGRFGPVRADGHGVHVFGPRGAFESGAREGVHAVWFADSTCATCRAQLLKVVAPPSDDTRGKPHSHSEDEIIYVIDGSITMGAYHLDQYTALCVPGDARYALVGGPEGHTFLNFRRDVSEQIYARNSEPLLETALARGGSVTADVR